MLEDLRNSEAEAEEEEEEEAVAEPADRHESNCIEAARSFGEFDTPIYSETDRGEAELASKNSF
jgi:hypothetical protein